VTDFSEGTGSIDGLTVVGTAVGLLVADGVVDDKAVLADGDAGGVPGPSDGVVHPAIATTATLSPAAYRPMARSFTP